MAVKYAKSSGLSRLVLCLGGVRTDNDRDLPLRDFPPSLSGSLLSLFSPSLFSSANAALKVRILGAKHNIKILCNLGVSDRCTCFENHRSFSSGNAFFRKFTECLNAERDTFVHFEERKHITFCNFLSCTVNPLKNSSKLMKPVSLESKNFVNASTCTIHYFISEFFFYFTSPSVKLALLSNDFKASNPSSNSSVVIVP